jgi:hypothetical protein
MPPDKRFTFTIRPRDGHWFWATFDEAGRECRSGLAGSRAEGAAHVIACIANGLTATGSR